MHVGILAIARRDKGPLALPIWYQYEDGDVVIDMSGDSLKAKLLRAAERATMTVQTETPPYKYVSVDGPVVVLAEPRDVFRWRPATSAPNSACGTPRTTRAPSRPSPSG